MHGVRRSGLKPTTPLRGSNRPKQAHSHPQRRPRFHNPRQPRPQRQPRFHAPRQPHLQRRHRFYQRPTKTTDLTTTRPHTARHETHDTNARRLTLALETRDTNARRPTLALETRDTNARRPTLALETRDTNARLQPPKTGPFTPAKATPVSPPPPTKPAKATPVSPTADKHNRRHRPQAPDFHHRDLSTGEMLNASYPQGHNSSFSSHSRREIIHQSGPYPQLHMVVSNCYLNSSHPSDRRFALLAFMERKCSCIASERTATF